ncbi:amino acid transporter [Paracidovorax avenae]|uniref:LysE/ArgO family amino acid transporter n=1 Tax=Paracidovorax avenae TaxID=80867 RepID=UPI000D16268F|nr:LysE/ArgO family amino acid transporter [Paracidovorax avenae]AVS92838.1 amino acid transporter [Paracidovorax avenae]AVS97486.1 amino acid transporter [Paracidovorax avenae]AVT04663.1 amino acid transporter [Paracidovorax avenae]AVT18695.1 amino acid transporter [Paracidovorax avenae]
MWWTTSFLQGLGTGAGLIIAIGAQNVHVLRTGLQRRHVALTAWTCIAVDAVAIACGVAGMGLLIQGQPLLIGAARWGGAAFLAWYGLAAARRALRGGARVADGAGQDGIGPARRTDTRQALAAVLAVSLLNPHMYLDTVVLLGAMGGQRPAPERAAFAAGAIAASTAWFLSLGFGARLLSPWFARPSAWRALDAFVAAVMLSLAAFLAFTPLPSAP